MTTEGSGEKEGVKTENNDHINLKVAGQDGSVVQFKIKRHTPLSKLMKAYCERQTFEFYSENSKFFTSRRGSRNQQMLGGKCEL
ncbi:hypothetical protein FD754_006454 [Muntiacus muntjak]|uniref:Rad60/SUMO-like domain-containing protein n=1 Tax=Muntiacus muntjak TaxID=9888 RepID=A0A5N3WNB2_MUNMU|nr:hypothetical protein FD754_006454 [Muntiacus muntjak]